MTHTRRKASTRKSHSPERRDNCSHWPNGDNMDAAAAWPQRLLRFGRTKNIGGQQSVGQDGRRDEKRRGREARRGTDRKRQQKVRKTHRKREKKKRDRKSYPLRGRTAGSDEEGLSCHVLLTRLEEGQRERERADRAKAAKNEGRAKPSRKSKSSRDKRGRQKVETKVVIAKTKSKKSNNLRDDEMILYAPEPRKRRLASLNAEAVNSLLLERASDQHPPSAKQPRRQHEEPAVEAGPLDTANAAWSGAAGSGCLKTSRSRIAPKAAGLSRKAEPLQGPKPVEKKKAKKANRGDLRGCVSQAILDAPAPRRLAGLTAATLLKLTSTSATSKQRAKAAPGATAATVTAEPVPLPAAANAKPQTRVKLKAKGRAQQQKKTKKKKKKKITEKGVVQDEDCTAAGKDKADFEPKVEWDGGGVGGCNHNLAKAGYQPRGMLGFPLKSVKEEQVETELNPCYCCPPEGSVGYCHRLAFFLGRQAYGEAGDPPLNAALMTPVKRECLVTSPAIGHAHPRHAALTLSPHPCLCTADHCFSSYYVHIAHPALAGMPSGTPLGSPRTTPLNFAPSSLCPNRVSGGPKLLGAPRVSHAAPGLGHPACCGSVGSPCYNEACGISGYAYRAMPPVASRGCSFSTGCSGCTHSFKTEGYPSPQGLAPSPRLSGCPPPPSSPSSTHPAEPNPLTPRSGREQPRPSARLRLAKDFPRAAESPPTSTSTSTSTLSSSTSRPEGPLASAAGGRTRLAQKRPAPAAATATATGLGSGGGARSQKRVSRCRATNGWRPVGVPVEREVFIAGDEETAPRRCYEGVERDGEVIHVRDTVLLRSGPRKKTLPYVAKISALWEDPKTGELMMSLFWYYRPEHTQGGKDPGTHCENEIFASRHQDENSVACIEDRCYVLPLAQYCRYCALLKQRSEVAPPSSGGGSAVVPRCADFGPPAHRCVPGDVDPELVYLCRHVYDFRFGRILKNLQ